MLTVVERLVKWVQALEPLAAESERLETPEKPHLCTVEVSSESLAGTDRSESQRPAADSFPSVQVQAPVI